MSSIMGMYLRLHLLVIRAGVIMIELRYVNTTATTETIILFNTAAFRVKGIKYLAKAHFE